MSIRDALRIPAREITDEQVYRERRQIIAAMAAVPALGAVGCSRAEPPSPTGRPVSPAVARSGFSTREERTTYQDATTYNNFYEFGTNKGDPGKAPKTLRTSPWVVAVGGECAKPGHMSPADLLRGLKPEERVYRLRCVEGWSMVIPWMGVSLGEVLKKFQPTSKAKYIAFTTLKDVRQMPGQSYASLDWPYREGLRIDEAMHPLTMLVTGMYGKPLPQQNGAPVRIIVPWKYGFKSAKSIVAITFTEKRPATSWNDMAADEYGFFSNVNPAVDHPRWSQKTERRIAGTGSKLFADRIPTRPFNGYGDQVASMYAGLDLKKWF